MLRTGTLPKALDLRTSDFACVRFLDEQTGQI
jgi:hypothetical protein